MADQQAGDAPNVEFGDCHRVLKTHLAAAYMAGMNLALTDDEATALARLLRQALDNDRFPLSPRLDPLKAILDKLDPPKPQPEPLPPLKSAMGLRVGRRRWR